MAYVYILVEPVDVVLSFAVTNYLIIIFSMKIVFYELKISISLIFIVSTFTKICLLV